MGRLIAKQTTPPTQNDPNTGRRGLRRWHSHATQVSESRCGRFSCGGVPSLRPGPPGRRRAVQPGMHCMRARDPCVGLHLMAARGGVTELE